jgi:3-oxoadipate enol-lactonase
MGVETSPTWPAAERGSGRPVVFLHGYPLNHEMWTAQLEGLSGVCHVVLPDLPGYGLEGSSPVPDTLSGFAEAVHARLMGRTLTPAVIVGHSFGGYIALELFRAHPEDFSGLVLTNTRSGADSPEAREKRLATIQRLADPSQHLDIEATARTLVAPATWEAGGRAVDIVLGMVRSASSSTIVGTLRAIAGRSDLTPVLSTVRVPTLVLWGEQDQLIPPAQTKSMVDRIPGSTGVNFPSAGHLPSVETPDAFDLALTDFLKRLPA